MTTRIPRPSPSFSSPLASGLQRFLEGKRAAGYRYDDGSARRSASSIGFSRGTSPLTIRSSPSTVIRDFVARRGHESDTTRGHRLSLIRQVCRFLALERTAHRRARSALSPHRPRAASCARVLSREEGRRFLQACRDRAHRALVAPPADDARDGLAAAVPHGAAGR